MNLVGARVLVSLGANRSHWLNNASVTIMDGRITAINRVAPNQEFFDMHAEGIAMLVPGFVDIHCHGGGGATFTSGNVEEARAAAAFHLQHGTTTVLASLVTAPTEDLLAACRALAPLVAQGVIAGIHLEGPYLSHLRCGAQDPRWLRDPNAKEIDELFAAAQGTIRQVTIAPELPGAIDAIHQIVRHGALAAIGHTNADASHVAAAIEAGARIATHLCNAMPPLHHRESRATSALLNDPNIICELIADGHHLGVPMIKTITRTAGRWRWCLITDSVSAAGQPDGMYTLGSQHVVLRNGQVRLASEDNPSAAEGSSSGALAGSILTMDIAVRNAIRWGIEAQQAYEAGSMVGANAIGLGASVGRLAVGRSGDVVGLDANHSLVAVWKGGVRVR